MLIDLSNPETFPSKLIKAVINYISSLPKTIIEEIQAKKIEHPSDVRLAIEDYFRPNKMFSEWLYEELEPIMENENLILFHATRLLNKDDIFRNGLLAIEWDWYNEKIKQVLKHCELSDDEVTEALNILKKEYERKYTDSSKGICFFSIYEPELIDDSSSFEVYCENIGGELATVFEEQMPKAYLELKKLGEPVIVKFCVPFAKIASYKKQDIIFHFVCNIVAKFIWDFNYFVLFDGQVICDIPPENILEVIPCLNSVL
jgi:hypothetical protein